MGIKQAGRVEPIELKRHDNGAVTVITRPPLSAITEEALAQVDPRFRDPDHPDVLVLDDRTRYLIGPPARSGTRILQRLT